MKDKFRGCLLGAVLGDVAGAPVEAESPNYIAKRFKCIADILSTTSVPEFSGPDWQVGRFTDDTQMMLSVAEWLLEDSSRSPKDLLARFAKEYQPWRRYGSGTAAILRMFPEHTNQWHELSTLMFPHGSHGNGSAMRVAPVALAYFRDIAKAADVAITSSRPTHSHPLAYQGAVLQTIAITVALTSVELSSTAFLQPMRAGLTRFSDLLQDTTPFSRALNEIEAGLKRDASCGEMAAVLGTGVVAAEAVPMAVYCFLRHPESYSQAIHEAVFIGGDTDTIACMTGAISGAFLGESSIPADWLGAVAEDRYTVAELRVLADRLFTISGAAA